MCDKLIFYGSSFSIATGMLKLVNNYCPSPNKSLSASLFAPAAIKNASETIKSVNSQTLSKRRMYIF